MKRVLITGKNSYIGESCRRWLEKNENEYIVEEVETKNDDWKNLNYAKYDTIIHVAGIAHVSSDPKMKDLYYRVNRDLAIEVAKKAKADGAKQFVFMSSMIIYGKDEPIGKIKEITSDTIPSATDFYGNSKLEADIAIRNLETDNFKVVIVRTPMVYGPGCKGNFPKLKKLAKMPFFPNIENKRSMIYIDNLCEFFKQIMDKGLSGTFYPQNKDYISTVQIIRVMAESMNKKIHFIKLFNPFIKLLSKKIGIINKVYGSKVYAKDLSGDFSYDVVENDESIRRSM